MLRTDPVRERMLKEAAADLDEAATLLAGEKQANQTGDPVAFAKQASLARAYANLKYVDDTNALIAAMAKVAEDKGELPYAVDHPYMNRFSKSLPGQIAGGIGGAVLGGLVGAATHSGHAAQEATLTGAGIGGAAGAALGGIPGWMGAVHEHDQAVDKLEGEGHKLNFVTKHPYITGAAGHFLGGAMGAMGAIAAHHVMKQDLARDVRQGQASAT